MALTNLKHKLFRVAKATDYYYTYKRLGIPRASAIPEVQRFVTRYPKWSRVVDAFAWAVDKYGDLTYPIFSRYSRIREKLLAGPVQLKIPSLNRREYYDPETHMLHANFQILVDFVEIQLPHEDISLTESLVGKPKYGKRYPQAGYAFLEKYHEVYGKHAETLLLYEYWTRVALPWFESEGLHVSKELANNILGTDNDWADRTLTEHLSDFHRELEHEMLKRLIAHRINLWT